ncbi:hypothetical protein UFOVP178_2 [uncultured Caudovirales phage]|uniref:Uncharacterized protein n=1 Tax=uncultured Caudovirales phage TaxID=2100421 RepID=A0A6J7WBB5_9CAUD|nr:hypothetical protein UFOVP178_2 [uncultured Caudovirales phage]
MTTTTTAYKAKKLNKFRTAKYTQEQRAGLEKSLMHTRRCLHGFYLDYNPKLGNRTTLLMKDSASIVIRLILN